MKNPEERKADIERIFSAVGVKPVHRQKIQGEEVFFADGYISPRLIDTGALLKFNVAPGEFPFGCFLTLWWTEQHKGIGSIAVFDAFHDPGMSAETKEQARINTTVHLAEMDFKRRKMH